MSESKPGDAPVPEGVERPARDGVSASRRRFARGGIAGPVVLSLFSRPVWGTTPLDPVACLSAQMSGNLSRENNLECTLGFSPGAWKSPNENAPIDAITPDSWVLAGYQYGTPIVPSPNQCSDYEGGTSFMAAFGGGPDVPMREVLCENPGSENSHLVAALLNASYPLIPNYPLTPAQVIALFHGDMLPPPEFGTLKLFLESTWG